MVKTGTFIKVTAFLMAIILVFLWTLIKEKNKNDYYLSMIKGQYSRAFEQLNSSLNNISIAMQKTEYVSSAKKLGSLSVEIFSEAEQAKTALSELPTGEVNISTIYRFLSQVGNYSMAVSKNITSENKITAQQKSQLELLSNIAQTITQVINDTNIEYNTPEQWALEIENKLNDMVGDQGLATSLTQLEEDLSDYPTLIYDGPYSDHILQKQPLMTSTAVEYSLEEALAKAKNVVGGNCDLKFDDMQGGKIECYRFMGDDCSITVSKNGGYVVYMRKDRKIVQGLLSYEQALMKARAFLENMQITNMVDTYFYTDNGVCVINFAYRDGQTICYTDLIKVGIAMDTGEVMLLETVGYLTNHTERAFKAPVFTKEDAAEQISSDLEISGTTVALIPTDAGGEVRCYEFLCKDQEDREILVYVNVLTLEEEQVFILLKSDGGTLVK